MPVYDEWPTSLRTVRRWPSSTAAHDVVRAEQTLSDRSAPTKTRATHADFNSLIPPSQTHER